MKICWDNLEKLEYRPDRGEWQDKKYQAVFYVYKDACKNCNEGFLAQKRSPGNFCNKHCSSIGEHNPLYDKKRSVKTKKKISKSLIGKPGHKHSEQTKKKISESNQGDNHPNWKGGYYSNNIPVYDIYAHQINFCEKVRRNKQDPNVLEVTCAYCGKWYISTRQDIYSRIKALNSLKGENRLYCSTQCKQECPIYNQILWPKGFKPTTSREVQPELRQMCFERDNFTCQKCNKTQDELECGLHCHHIEGIKWEPLESADLDKVITFCKTCHIKTHKQPDCSYQDMKCQ